MHKSVPKITPQITEANHKWAKSHQIANNTKPTTISVPYLPTSVERSARYSCFKLPMRLPHDNKLSVVKLCIEGKLGEYILATPDDE